MPVESETAACGGQFNHRGTIRNRKAGLDAYMYVWRLELDKYWERFVSDNFCGHIEGGRNDSIIRKRAL